MTFCKCLKPSHFKSDILVFNLNKLYKKTKVELNIVENHHSWIPRKIKVSNSCKVPPKSHSINLKINNIFVFVEHCFYIYKMFFIKHLLYSSSFHSNHLYFPTFSHTFSFYLDYGSRSPFK